MTGHEYIMYTPLHDEAGQLNQNEGGYLSREIQRSPVTIDIADGVLGARWGNSNAHRDQRSRQKENKLEISA